MADLLSPGTALSQRASVEQELLTAVERAVDSFLSLVYDDAVSALSSAVLLAAGRDPFAFTNVRKHWYGVVRELARRRADIVSSEVERALLDSSLPVEAHRDVSDVLLLARAEGWTEYRTKRHLSAILIVKERPGTLSSDPEHERYKNQVRRLARTTATSNTNQLRLQQMDEAGYTHKRWVTRHDEKTRHAHTVADGQTVPLSASFTVGGYPLQFPGDPVAPLSQTANCRCALVATSSRSRTASATIEDMSESTVTMQTDDECVPCSETADTLQTDDTGSTQWAGVIGVEGEMTGDGRLIEANALDWETPIPLRYVSSDVGAHNGAQVVGRIHEVIRLDDGRLWAEGGFDEGSEHGREAARQVTENLTNGISMDLDNVAFEVRVASDLGEMTRNEQDGETVLSDEPDESGKVTVKRINPDDEVRVTTSGRIRAATIVAIPAFASARIERLDEPTEDDIDQLASLLYDSGDDETDSDPYSTDEFKNWVEKAGGLPRYIKRISKHLQRKGMTQGHAIAVAVNAVKRMCSTGDLNFPGKQSVNAISRAQACTAVAQWEAMKMKTRATSAESTVFAPSVRGPLEDLPTLTEEQKKEIDNAEDADLPSVLEGIASNIEDVESKAPFVKAARLIRELLDDGDTETSSVTASASINAKRPPSSWFKNPGFTGPTALTVTEEGRVYGHLAAWNTCHTSHTQPGQCVKPPRSATGYAYFHTGSLIPSDGEEISVGRLTLGTGHAKDSLGPVETMAHYDETGTIAAYVRVGEDSHGIWVAGATRPGLSEEKRMELRASPLSGDWRRVGTSLELVAALAVNVAGFPIPKGMVASGHMTSLVASGVVPQSEMSEGLSPSDLRYIKRMSALMAKQDALTASALYRRVQASELSMRVHSKEMI